MTRPEPAELAREYKGLISTTLVTRIRAPLISASGMLCGPGGSHDGTGINVPHYLLHSVSRWAPIRASVTNRAGTQSAIRCAVTVRRSPTLHFVVVQRFVARHGIDRPERGSSRASAIIPRATPRAAGRRCWPSGSGHLIWSGRRHFIGQTAATSGNLRRIRTGTPGSRALELPSKSRIWVSATRHGREFDGAPRAKPRDLQLTASKIRIILWEGVSAFRRRRLSDACR